MDKNIIEILKLILPILLCIFPLIVKREKRICITNSSYFLPGKGELVTIEKMMQFLKYLFVYLASTAVNILIFIALNCLINSILNSNSNYFFHIYLSITLFYFILLYLIGIRKLKLKGLDKYDKQKKVRDNNKIVLLIIALFLTMVSAFGFMNIIYTEEIYNIATGLFYVIISTATYFFLSIKFSNITDDCSAFYKFKVHLNNNSSVECDEIIDLGKKLLLKKYCKHSTPKGVTMIEINKNNILYIKSSIKYKQYPKYKKKK